MGGIVSAVTDFVAPAVKPIAGLLGGASGVGNLLGGAAQAGGAYLSADAAREAAAQSAAGQIAASQIAAEAAKFRPVGVTTRFGQSQFTTGPEGYITGAGYTVSPELRGIQDYLMSQAGSTADTQRLLSLGRGYLATTPQEAAQQYMTQQQGLLAPSREQQLASLRNKQFQTGRIGLATGGTTAGGLQQTNPEMAAYYNALAQQDAQLAAGARKAAQQDITFGQGLLTSAYSPITTPLGVAGQIESLGQAPLDIGAQLGGRAAQSGAAQAQSLLAGGLGAARTLQAANQYSPTGALLSGFGSNPQATTGLGNWFNSILNPTPSWEQSNTGLYRLD